MNGRTFSQNLRKRGKSHHHPITHPPLSTQQMGLSPFLCDTFIPCFATLNKWVSLPFCAIRASHVSQHSENGSLSLSVQPVHSMLCSSQQMGPILHAVPVLCGEQSLWHIRPFMAGRVKHTHTLSLSLSNVLWFLFFSSKLQYLLLTWQVTRQNSCYWNVNVCAQFVSVSFFFHPLKKAQSAILKKELYSYSYFPSLSL